MTQDEREAIDIIMDSSVDFKGICVELAKTNASALVLVAKGYVPYAKYVPFIRDGQFIQAIKMHRELTGVGLKEAKDFIEDIRAKAVEKGDLDESYIPEWKRKK